MKKVLLTYVLLSCVYIVAEQEEQTRKPEDKKTETFVKLQGREIQGLDGIPNALDGEAIRQILLVRAKIKEMLLGHLDKVTKKRAGKYLYNGTKYSIDGLVSIEEQLIKDDNTKQLNAIHKCLEDAKREFLDTTEEFIERISWTKSLVIDLIEKSFKARKITKSLCFEWINTPVGKETEVFAKHVKTVREFDTFLNHVNSFLGDLIYSCPKAFEQFKHKYGKK